MVNRLLMIALVIWLCPLVAESGPSKQRFSSSLNVRFWEKQTFKS